MSARRSSGTRSGAVSRCSSPTSFPRSPSASCSSPAAVSDPRSAGASLFIAATAGPGRIAGSALARGLASVGLRPSADVAEVARGYASLADADRRGAFLATLRSVVGTEGQRVGAGDRLYLAGGVPALIVWGRHDRIIPVAHGEDAHQTIAGSYLEIFDNAGHMPQLEAPGRFVAVLERFLMDTEPAQWSSAKWRSRLATASE
jgi:pimeloyl-ACP methyl ester carboxylesterase